jgi:hypothetical protein
VTILPSANLPSAFSQLPTPNSHLPKKFLISFGDRRISPSIERLGFKMGFKIDASNFPAHTRRMAKKAAASGRAGNPLPAEMGSGTATGAHGVTRPTKKEISLARRTGEGRGEGRPSSLLDTRVVYCGDNLEQLAKLPDACVDLIYIDPPFNSSRNYDGGQSGTDFWGETKEKRAFEDRHENTKAYIDYLRPRCVQLARGLKQTGSFYYHCDWHASHYVKVMLDQIFGENNFQSEIICHSMQKN